MSEAHELDLDLLQSVARCPNDGGELEARVSGGTGLLRCQRCARIFAVEDGIAILLPDGKRNPRFEIRLLERLAGRYEAAGWAADVRSTLAQIATVDPRRVWEWQDAEFWDRDYEGQMAAGKPADWRYRLQQRRRAVQVAFRGMGSSLTILDVGAGEGQTTAELVPEIFAESSYVALDMSSQGLRLNRSRYRPKRGLYLLASADDPPLADRFADVATFYGILHHTEGKAASLLKYRAKLKGRSRLLLAEAVSRPRATPRLLRRWIHHGDESAHEERIPLPAFRQALSACGRLAYYRQFFTPLYGLLSRFRGPREVLLFSESGHALALACDDLVSRTLGALIPVFRAGEVLAVVYAE